MDGGTLLGSLTSGISGQVRGQHSHFSSTRRQGGTRTERSPRVSWSASSSPQREKLAPALPCGLHLAQGRGTLMQGRPGAGWVGVGGRRRGPAEERLGRLREGRRMEKACNLIWFLSGEESA